ncbi:YciI family protein [Nocardioides sp. cx-169]|uniref:YciI family protein n=1 Tax=Nocardioides sp. cx-169 TaxID=2899080 RepID=UPI001E4240E2|nr:YciI family protein [Nocardioides sp. cx-169]MCD4533213.1 YciI family protein [Nocardioides sp. cx-169]
MKYVILIHSNPQPWGHPTGEYNSEFQALPAAERARMDREFEELLTELQRNGELVIGEALGDPATATVYRWESGEALVTDGPYSEVKEHLAGFFMIDVADRERAEQVARRFAGPGDTIELRPAMWPGGGDD